jgi:disulfide bond formation protein DsbB
MMVPRLRVALLLSALAAAAALGVAFWSEWYGGLIPCPLCLIERWPYRVAIVLGLVGFVLPRVLARLTLGVLALTILAGAGIAALHVGVEWGLWPSPLPECSAPHITGGSVSQMLGNLPDLPSKSCDEPTYLIAWIPVSMAAMNLIYGLVFSGAVATFLTRSRGNGP